MGNCISGLAFKPEDDDDEYRYGGRHPKVSKIDENKNCANFFFRIFRHVEISRLKHPVVKELFTITDPKHIRMHRLKRD